MTGRQLLASVALLQGLSATAFAQSLELGTRAGRIWSDERWGHYSDGQWGSSNKSRLTYSAGAFVRRQLWRGFSIQPELQILGKGYSYPTEPTRQSTYLEAPLLIRLDKRIHSVRLFATFGGAFAYELQCTVTSHTIKGYYKDDCDGPSPIDQPTGTRATDLSLTGGIGTAIDVGRGSVTLDLRHEESQLDVSTSRIYSPMFNMVSGLSIGYSIRR
jgi:hypothetical protein